MASEQDRREFGSRNADAVPPPIPSIPKIPKAIKDGLGGKFRKDWDKFENEWEDWRKKVILPTIPSSSTILQEATAVGAVNGAAGGETVGATPAPERIIVERTEVEIRTEVQVQVPTPINETLIYVGL